MGIDKRLLKVADTFLADYSEVLSSRGCNDWEWPEGFSEAEKTEIVEKFHEINGNPQEYEHGDTTMQDFMMVHFIREALRVGFSL